MIAIQNDKLMTMSEILANFRRHMKPIYYDDPTNRDIAVYVLSAALEESEDVIRGAIKERGNKP